MNTNRSPSIANPTARRRRFASLLPSLLAALSSSAAFAGGFAPNHLFVGSGSSNLVTEFDETGQFVRTIGDGANLQGAMTPVFGPDGAMYVQNYQANTLAVFEPMGPHGTKVTEIGATSSLNGPQQFVFGPNGHLFVASFMGARIVEMDTQGHKVQDIGVGAGMSLVKGIAFGADGNLYVVDNNDLFVFDPSGSLVSKKTSVATTAANIVFGRNGNLFIADPGAHVVHEITTSGHLIDDIAPKSPFDPYGVALCANGDLLVSNYTGGADEILEIDAAGAIVRTIGNTTILDAASGLAIAPTRFEATIAGTLNPTGGGPTQVVEKHAVVSISPGAQTVLLTLPGFSANANELSDILGLKSFAFHGEESATPASAKKYGIHAFHRPEWFSNAVMGSIELQCAGESGMLGPQPKSVKGTLHLSGPAGVFGGTIKSKKKL